MDYKSYFHANHLLTIEDYLKFEQSAFKYGWFDQENNKHYGVNEAKTYCLQTPEELLKSRIGICWDRTELHRCFFEKMTTYKIETYYLFYDDHAGCPSHTILAFYKNNKVYWFEPMFTGKKCYYSGIHEYQNIQELLMDFINVFITNAVQNKWISENFDALNLKLYKYKKPKSHINGIQMRRHINQSKLININNLIKKLNVKKHCL